MYKAQVLTFWTNDRTPHVFNFLSTGDSGMDVTGQPTTHINPDPNLLVAELWCGDETLAKIEAHPDYGEAAVLWSEEIEDETTE